MMPSEEYRPVPGFDGYWLRSDGTAWREWIRVRDCHGQIKWERSSELHQVVMVKSTNGYMMLFIKSKGKKPFRAILSRAMLEAFVGPPPEPKMCACHNDGNKENNHISNLRWDTRSGNEQDKIEHGTSNRGGRNGMAKFSEDVVREVRRRYEEIPNVQRGSRNTKPFGAMKGLAAEFGINILTLKSMIYYNWKHIK